MWKCNPFQTEIHVQKSMKPLCLLQEDDVIQQDGPIEIPCSSEC